MKQGDDEAEKTHEPTRHKLDEARKKGDIAKSADLPTAAGYGGILLAALIAGATSVKDAATLLMTLIEQPAQLAPLAFDGAATPVIGGILFTFITSISPWFVLPAALVLLSILAQRGFVVAPSKVQFKLSRISLLSNARNKFGRNGLFEFAKSFAKLLIFSICLALFISARLGEILGVLHSNPHIASRMLARLCIDFLFVVLLVALSIGALDYLWQRFEHRRKNMMSYKELQDEHKSNEGDPQMKQERRQRAQSIAMNQMMADVPEADVIIVNPTHYAIALRWSRQRGAAPECVAKGVDEIASQIRKIAMESGVPIHSDPPTARALHATTEIGEQIPTEHYRAVAAAIRFADTMRDLRRRGR